MHKIKIVSHTLFFIMIATFITGCTDIVMSKNETVDNSNNQGFVAVAFDCSGAYLANISYFRPNASLAYDIYETYSGARVGGICKLSPNYTLLKLPVGSYQFTGVAVDTTYTSTFSKRINFQVYPNTVTYIGKLYIDATFPSVTFKQSVFGPIPAPYYKLSVFNDADIDIPWFLSKYKAIPSDRYTVNIINLNNNN